MAMKLQSTTSVLSTAPRASLRLAPAASLVQRRTAALPAASKSAFTSAPLRFSATSVPRQERASLQVVASSDADLETGVDGRNDYSPVLAVLGFVAVWYNRLNVDRTKLLHAFAALQLFVTAVNLITRRGVGDKISNFIGPAVLAVSVLNIQHVTYLDAATALFGYFLSENLDGLFGIPFYAFLVTLAIAMYTGYGTLWYTIAYALAGVGRIYAANKNKEAVPVLVVPAIAATAWAIYKEHHFVWALVLYLAQTVWSAFIAVDTLSKSAE